MDGKSANALDGVMGRSFVIIDDRSGLLFLHNGLGTDEYYGQKFIASACLKIVISFSEQAACSKHYLSDKMPIQMLQ